MTLGQILISLLIGLGVLLLFMAGFIFLRTAMFSPRQKKVKPP